MKVHLGFEVGSGAPVEIPLAHTFVTGQTQLSGKTTALRAIVERSGLRALAFVTKRGETFDGRRIPPYLPREGDRPMPWRLVETILASALGQRQMKYERLWIVNAAKGARSLADVRANVTRLQLKHKSGNAGDMYMLLGEYLDLVLPEMRALAAADTLDLQPGLNVMDLTGVGLQLQARVIRAALEQINLHETGVLTVFPEAWEFAPRGRSAPAKDEAIAMARKGAVLQNFLLCDSQDLAGVDTVVRQAASVWLLGVQRELNELKRTLQMIPAGVKRPKAEDVAQLELGQFYACWGRHAVKVYVQPSTMDADMARKVATGVVTVDQVARQQRSIEREAADARRRFVGRNVFKEEEQVNAAEAKALAEENAKLRAENADLHRRIEAIERGARTGPEHAGVAGPDRIRTSGDERQSSARTQAAPVSTSAAVPLDGLEAAYQQMLARLVSDASKDPTLLKVIMAKPELQIAVQRHVVHADGNSIRGRIARLIADDFWTGASRTSAQVLDELVKRGADRPSNIELGNEMKAFCEMGFFTRENKWYSLVPGAVVNIVESGS